MLGAGIHRIGRFTDLVVLTAAARREQERRKKERMAQLFPVPKNLVHEIVDRMKKDGVDTSKKEAVIAWIRKNVKTQYKAHTIQGAVGDMKVKLRSGEGHGAKHFKFAPEKRFS